MAAHLTPLLVAQVVVLGTGKKSLETKVKALEAKFPGVAKGVVKFSTPLAHLINAGARVSACMRALGMLYAHGMLLLMRLCMPGADPQRPLALRHVRCCPCSAICRRTGYVAPGNCMSAYTALLGSELMKPSILMPMCMQHASHVHAHGWGQARTSWWCRAALSRAA